MTTSLVDSRPAGRTQPRADAVRGEDVRVGPVDHRSAEQVPVLIPELVIWSHVRPSQRATRLRAAATILAWLEQHPGQGWQSRWLAAEADRDTQWLTDIAGDDARLPKTRRVVMTYGIAYLLLARVVLPDYTFLASYRARFLFAWARQQFRPDLFAQLEQAGRRMGMKQAQIHRGLNVVTRIVLHTGRDVDHLTAEDFYKLREWCRSSRGLRGVDSGAHAAWDLLQAVAILPGDKSLRSNSRSGRRSPEQLVDRYHIQCRPVRDVLVRYLTDRAASLDHSSLRYVTAILAGLFWADIERHHPEQNTLRLPTAVAEQWKTRLRTYKGHDGVQRPRKDYQRVLGQVRSFYLDIQEWALEDPFWAGWSAPSPVRSAELAGMMKARRRTVSAIHQRVRERLPHLGRLSDSADDYRVEQGRLLEAAARTPIGATFEHDGTTYRRTIPKTYSSRPDRHDFDKTLIEHIATGEKINLSHREDDAFWAWAVIETLRHTGIRIEELLEVTSLAIVSYRLPATGEVVPLLQIVPSKSDAERLLLVSPELASVLATIVKRVRDDNGGTIPAVARYDQYERTLSPPLPHLFQRRRAWRRAVMSPRHVSSLLNAALDRACIRDATGQPLRYTPHDFRRMFTTEAVTGGLPVHIAAKLLGHHNLATVESYLAVFQDDLIRTYRSFLDKRRAWRPETEYREPTDVEWREFEQHFEQRKLELGTCGRPYGSPCQHEHACIRCPMLRVEPQQRNRLAAIIQNLNDRIAEARINGWLGEVEGLRVSLTAAANKLTSLDRSQRLVQASTGPTHLGMPAKKPPGMIPTVSAGPTRTVLRGSGL